jgi:Ca2+-binding RTX toxin-like protein
LTFPHAWLLFLDPASGAADDSRHGVLTAVILFVVTGMKITSDKVIHDMICKFIPYHGWHKLHGKECVTMSVGINDLKFSPVIAYSSGHRVKSAKVADVNLDGKPDIIAYSFDYSAPGHVYMLVYLGDGAGGFQLRSSSAARGKGEAFTVADVNGDGKPDIISPDYEASAVSVVLGNGDGSFRSPTFYKTGRTPTAVEVADVNGDGRSDIVTTNQDTVVSVLMGNGDGSFRQPVSCGIGFCPSQTVVADVNRDGRPDIITVGREFRGNVVSVLFGAGHGSFVRPISYATGFEESRVAVWDVNHDGALDIVATGVLGVSTLLGRGDGSFRAAIHSSAVWGEISVVDMNFDGELDIIGGSSVLLGKGDGSFQQGNAPLEGCLVASDLNGDGKPDVVTTDFGRGGLGNLKVMLNLTSTGHGSAHTSGAVTVDDMTPTKAHVLKAKPAFTDPDGVAGPIAYKWESSSDGVHWKAIAGADKACFTPGAAQVDQELHVIATYIDGAGSHERLVSATTGFVGNVISGSRHRDTLVGTRGADIISGLGGNDFIDGRGGSDVMTGGAGDDAYVVDDIGDGVVEKTGGGRDTVLTTLANYTLPDNVENLVLKGTERFSGGGNRLDNTITAGKGADWLTGGAGADTFVFAKDFGMDRILDFTVAGAKHDVLQIDHTLFANLDALLAASADCHWRPGDPRGPFYIADADITKINGVVITVDAHNAIGLWGVTKKELLAHPEDFHFV